MTSKRPEHPLETHASERNRTPPSAPPNTKPAKIPALAWAAACLIALAGLCSASLLALAGGAALIPARATQSAADGPPPTARVQASPIPSGTSLQPPPDPTRPPAAAPGALPHSIPASFQDDFSDPSSGWQPRTGTGWKTGYDRGGFRITISQPDRIAWATPGLHYQDVSLEVSAARIAGADENFFGLICRYQDEDNFYLFAISGDGHYVIGKYVNGEFASIGERAMGYSLMIHQGRTANRLRADCTGSTLALYANDTRLAEVEDSSFTAGDVGLAAAAYEIGSTDILFDDFVSSQP